MEFEPAEHGATACGEFCVTPATMPASAAGMMNKNGLGPRTLAAAGAATGAAATAAGASAGGSTATGVSGGAAATTGR